MMRNLFLGLAALPLLACTPAADKADTGEAIARDAGVGDAPTGRRGSPVARGADRGPIPVDIDEGLEPSPDQATNSSVAAARPTMIPAQFHGRWGLVAADCTSTRGDAKGLLTIDAGRLVFYESRGVLDRIDTWSPVNRFTAKYGFTGEGMEWERVITLERNGSKLRRTERGGEEGRVDLTYTACPASAVEPSASST